MPQSFTRLYAHLIFSTKERWPWLDDIARPQMHAHLAAAMREMGSPYVVVGGVADHVHLLFDMGKMLAPATLVKEVKRVSSKFAKTLGPKYEQFYWQRGYGMFSVSPTHRADVEAYIRGQEEHHRERSFQDEFRDFLIRYGIEYDERYVWD